MILTQIEKLALSEIEQFMERYSNKKRDLKEY